MYFVKRPSAVNAYFSIWYASSVGWTMQVCSYEREETVVGVCDVMNAALAEWPSRTGTDSRPGARTRT